MTSLWLHLAVTGLVWYATKTEGTAITVAASTSYQPLSALFVGTCAVISRGTNSAGTETVFNSASTATIGLGAMIGSDYSVVCYIATGLHCKPISRSGTSLTTGTGTEVQASGNSPAGSSVAAQDANNVVVCYESSNKGKCTVVSRSGGSLSTGSEYIYSSSQVGAVSVASLSSTRSVVCFRDKNNNDYGE